MGIREARSQVCAWRATTSQAQSGPESTGASHGIASLQAGTVPFRGSSASLVRALAEVEQGFSWRCGCADIVVHNQEFTQAFIKVSGFRNYFRIAKSFW